MLKYIRQHHRGASVIEYIILIVMFLTAILVMQKQIARGIFGRWKGLGDALGHGVQYDPATTLECGRHVPRVYNSATQQTTWGTEIWYEQNCFDCCRYANAVTGTLATQCSGFTSSELAYCRNRPTGYEITGCCAQKCQTTNCSF